MAVIQRWELVEFSVDPPADHHDITEILDTLRAELGGRWEHRSAVQVVVGDDGEIVFRYRKPRTDHAWVPLGYAQDDSTTSEGE